jgi:UDP-N-acetylglucosamine--N-acetylmuramyl-(pentapeptide) pyrophosphoryl-undecaprenol N-acetylglucosamine transferase
MKRNIHLVFTGGGTAGHLFPGLAVAERLVAEIRRLRITFAGSGKEFERRLVAAAGFEYYALPCRPLPRRARETVSFVLENVAGYLAAKRFLKDAQVAGVVGLGGYASVPMGRAAVKCRVPLVLLEQNVLPGRATRWLAPAAAVVCTSFAQTGDELHQRAVVRVTGNPIRRIGEAVAEPGVAAPSRPCQLLVLGGSSGARSLNENVPRALYKAAAAENCPNFRPSPPRETQKIGLSPFPLAPGTSEPAGWRILHQTGDADLAATRELYRKLDIDATVSSFVADMPAALLGSDLAICRAGGTTLAELAAAAVPCVLLPYPHAADDHQNKNAQVFAAAGGAVLLDERTVSGRLDDQLAEAVGRLVGDADRLAAMSAAMRTLARPHAAADVAALVWSVVSSQARHPRLPVAA